MRRPFVLYPLVALHLLLGVGALYGGFSLMTDATGFGVKPEWLAESPFKNYLLPGLILFIFNGLFPILIVLGLVLKPAWRWANILNIYRDRHWSWTYSLFSGIIVIFWIAVQITMVPYFWLQPTFLLVGLLILIFTLWPGMMQFYQICEKKTY